MSEPGPSVPSLTASAKADKAGLAMLLRRGLQNLLADQTVLDHNRRFRENQARLMEARMAKFGAAPAGAQPGEAMGDINIDSPVTQQHYWPAPRRSWLPAVLFVAIALATGAGAAAALPVLLSRAAQQPSPQTETPAGKGTGSGTSTTIERKEGFLIELVPTDKK